MKNETFLKDSLTNSKSQSLQPASAQSNVDLSQNNTNKISKIISISSGILIVICIVGIGTYTLWNKTNKENNSTTSVDTQVENSKPDTDNNQNSKKLDKIKDGWSLYTSSTYNGLNVQYPSDWEVIEETRYDIQGFSFKFTNGSIVWRFEPEYMGVLALPPLQDDIPFDWCIGGLINSKYEFDTDLYQDVDENIKCTNTHLVIIIEHTRPKNELTADDYSILEEITKSLSNESL